MNEILFVGSGNTCRSVMCEYLLNDMLKKSGNTNYEAASCGINSGEDIRPDDFTVLTMKKRGIDVSGHVSRHVSADILSGAKIIYCMSAAVAASIITYMPGLEDKIKILGKGIVDPDGATEKTYDTIRETLEAKLFKIADDLND